MDLAEMVGSIGLGLGLASACGFRVFLPLLALSLATRLGWVSLDSSWAWLASGPALVGLAVAAIVELAAYYVPAVDHALDALAAPAAAMAGTLVAASQLVGTDGSSLSPALAWLLAAVAGGGLATGVRLGAAGVRGVSTVTTAGVGNPAVATAENVAAAGLSAVSIVAPLVLAAVVALGVVLIVRRRWRRARWSRPRALSPADHNADQSSHGLAG